MSDFIRKALGALGLAPKPRSRLKQRYRPSYFYTIEEKSKLVWRPTGTPYAKISYTVTRRNVSGSEEQTVSFMQVLDPKGQIINHPTDQEVMRQADDLIDEKKEI